MLKHFVLICLVLSIVAAEKDYTDLVGLLKKSINDQKGPYWHSAYNRLAYISDSFGPRLWGSKNLELVISELAGMAQKEGF